MPHSTATLYHAVLVVLEQAVCFVDTAQRETVRDERRRIDKALPDKVEDLGTVTTVYTASLEGKVLAVHVGQRQQLRTVIKRDHRNDGIGTRTLPRKAEGIVGPRDLDNAVGPAVFAAAHDVFAHSPGAHTSTSG